VPVLLKALWLQSRLSGEHTATLYKCDFFGRWETLQLHLQHTHESGFFGSWETLRLPHRTNDGTITQLGAEDGRLSLTALSNGSL
jgi:hypothetical protein